LHALEISIDRENEHKLFIADVVTEFIEGLVETYPGLQYLDGLPEVKKIHFFRFLPWMCAKSQLIYDEFTDQSCTKS